ncbi:unnamed protein product [Orchesella dallaii]|uniref:Cuticle protein 6 n=1 Tax=Orchesella dallaii TaxID=48710 RepID=A0ABP1Q794_9HEXA
MWSHCTWCLVVALSVLAEGTKGPRQIVYQIRPAPASAFNSQDGTFLLDDGITEFQFPTFGLKTGEKSKVPNAITSNIADSGDNDSSSSSSSSASSSSPSEESSSATKEEITEVPKFGASQTKQAQQQILQLQTEQARNHFFQLQPDKGPQQQFFQLQPDRVQQQQQQYYQFPSEKEPSPFFQLQPDKNQQQFFQFQPEKNQQSFFQLQPENGPQPFFQLQPEKTQPQPQQIIQFKPQKGQQQFLQLQPEQIQQILQQFQQPQQNPDIGPKYEYKSIEENNADSDDIKTAQTEVITEEKLQSAYSERREKRKKKEQQTPMDASYAFGYETDEAARHEVADPDGNVKGWYTYVDDEGTTRKIIYTAGAGKGFVVLGKEKVRGPSQTPQQRKHNKPSNKVNTDYRYAADTSTIASVKHQKGSPSGFRNGGGGGGGDLFSINNWNDLAKAGTSNPPHPATIVGAPESTARTKKPVFIVKIRRPVHKDQYDDDDSGDISSQSSQATSSASSSQSGEYNHEYDNGGGGGDGRGGTSLKADPDSSYVFGYETDTSNRLEKADPYGNVKGSYSYIDPDGVKRTVHYIAGGSTGFQVINASPSITRGVRLEAPQGFVVKRVPQSLRAAESRFPVPITVPQPSAIVYHIHPDSGWKPWEPTLRKRKIKIHRKKLPKAVFENPQREGIILLQTHGDPRQQQQQPQPQPMPSATFFKEKVTSSGGAITATETRGPEIPFENAPPPIPSSRRRHTPQRGYTADHHHFNFDDDDSKEHTLASTYMESVPKASALSSSSVSSSSSSSSASSSANAVHEREPLLYSPTFESLRDSGSSRMPVVPNPIQLQPTQVAIKNRGAPTQSTGLDTSSSNHHPVAFTSDGKLQVDVPTVVIEAIEAKSPSLVKDGNRNVAAPAHQLLPEAAALMQQNPAAAKSSLSSNKGLTPTSPSYETSAASYQPSAASAPTPAASSVNTLSIIQVPSASSSVASPRSRRRHHRSKTSTTTTPTSPSVSSASSNAIRAGSSSSSSSGGSGNSNVETTTVMSSSKRLINRLAPTDHEAAQQ